MKFPAAVSIPGCVCLRVRVCVAILTLTLTLTSSASAFVPSHSHSHLHSHRVSSSAVNPTISSSHTKGQSHTKGGLKMSFFDNIPTIPNPFASPDDSNPVQPRPPSGPPPISNEAEALFGRAKAIIASDLGLRDPSILADDFTWVGPNVVTTGPLTKEEYMAAGQFFNLRKAFPDLDYRAHDFRLDPMDNMTIRVTARTVGTMRGELRLRSDTVQPNGKRMVCPPEAISMTFDPETGKLKKLCSGFCMDRLVGNTAGLCGVMAAATVAGVPPSEWELYPPAVVVSRFFSRSVKQLKEDQYVMAPFPESVMVQLAKGVLAADTGTKDSDLLSDDYTFCGPYVGPLKKEQFIEEFTKVDMRSAFPDLDENYSNFRVDPYDPYRIWYDVKATGTRTGELDGIEPDGKRYIGPPEAASMTFDDDGYCTRMTGGAVMDPTDCNTGGLGGIFGILYAAGAAPSPIQVRPLPQIISRIQKGLLSPITGKDVDDFASVEDKTSTSATFVPPPPKVETAPQVVAKSPTIPLIPLQPPKVKVAPPPTPPTPPRQAKVQAKVEPQKVELPKVSSSPEPPKEKPSAKTKKNVPIVSDPGDPVTDVFAGLFGTKSGTESKSKRPQAKAKTITIKSDSNSAAATAKQEASKRETAKREAAEATKREIEAKREAAEVAKRDAELKRKQALAEAEAKREAAEQKRRDQLAAMEEKKRIAEEKQATLQKAKTAQKVLKKATKPSATISLGFFSFGQKKTQDEEATEQTSSAPRGVPTLKNWRLNKNGSVTGSIYGSKVFGSGESITTSPLKGKPTDNAVVQTKTGSKYFLESKSAVGRKGGFSLFGGGGDKKEASTPQPNRADSARKVAAQRQASIDAKKQQQEAAAAKRQADLEARKQQQAEAASRKQAELESRKQAAAQRQAEVEARKQQQADAAARKKAETEAKNQQQSEAAARKQAEIEAKKEAAAKKQQQIEAAAAKKAEAAAAKKQQQAEAAAAKKQQQAEAATKKKEEAEAAAKRKAEAEAAKREKAEVAARKREEAAALKREKAEAAARLKKEREEVAAKKKLQASKKQAVMKDPRLQKAGSGTISLFGGASAGSTGKSGAPAGVPVISGWKKNGNGSISGTITGSSNFKEGERVTTSKLAAGQVPASGKVVSTASGSKYFLK